MSEPLPFVYRTSQLYGWPFYIVRKAIRATAARLLAAADGLSAREKYPVPLFLRPLLPANAELRNAHRGRRCFVIGNGPSLAAQNLEPLRDEVTFAMNGFVNHPAIHRIRPTYYCLVDPSYFDGSAPSELFLDRLFAEISDSHFILPYAAAQKLLARHGFPADRATFVTFAGTLATSGTPRLDLTRPLPQIQNCAQLAIMVATYVGCSPIYLLGMDHDWAAHRGTETHFYPQKTLGNHPVAHGEWDRYPYLAILEDALKVWRGYQALKRRAEAMGLQIINASRGGFLDVFERADFESLISGATEVQPACAAA